MKYLYCCKKAQFSSDVEKNSMCASVKVFTPKIKKLLLCGEKKNIKTLIVRLLFQIRTKGKAKIYYVADENKLKHTSYVVPRCGKFPFLDENDYEIGPCFTYPDHRGKGIYPEVLRFICCHIGDHNTTFYMIVDEKNIASIKGIEKAGFKKCGVVEVSKLTKRYKLCKKYR